jgi:glycosyltransferase involved in cell wall biosynthesis
VKTGEPIPLDSTDGERLHRTGLMAKLFAAAGHEITWFTSTFDRVQRRNVFDEDRTVHPFPGVTIKLIHSPGYRRSFSYGRVRDQRIVSERLVQAMQAEKLPDVIVCAYPTVELARASVTFGRRNNVPVVLDIRDMWPNIILDSAPILIKPLVWLALRRMVRDARFACANATAITGITGPFVKWGLNCGKRRETQLDRDFPLAHLSGSPSRDRLEEAGRFWDALGVANDVHAFRAIFLGTLGHQFDIETVLRAARNPKLIERGIQFVICGAGDKLATYRNMSANCPHVLFPGWIDLAQTHVLMRRSKLGLDPLPDRYDFLATINNKAIEYLGAGLPVVSSPRSGVLFELLQKHRCGLSYDPGDVEGLVRILLRLASGPHELDKFATNAIRLFDERFQAEKVYGELCAHLARVVHSSKLANEGES